MITIVTTLVINHRPHHHQGHHKSLEIIYAIFLVIVLNNYLNYNK